MKSYRYFLCFGITFLSLLPGFGCPRSNMINLLTVLAFYSHFFDARNILLEANKEQRILNLSPISGLPHQYRYYDVNLIFHRTHKL